MKRIRIIYTLARNKYIEAVCIEQVFGIYHFSNNWMFCVQLAVTGFQLFCSKVCLKNIKNKNTNILFV